MSGTLSHHHRPVSNHFSRATQIRKRTDKCCKKGEPDRNGRHATPAEQIVIRSLVLSRIPDAHSDHQTCIEGNDEPACDAHRFHLLIEKEF